MKPTFTLTLISIVGCLIVAQFATAEDLPTISAGMESKKEAVSNAGGIFSEDEFADSLPTEALSAVVQTPIGEPSAASRSAKDTQIYKSIAPSVVLIVTKDVCVYRKPYPS